MLEWIYYNEGKKDKYINKIYYKSAIIPNGWTIGVKTMSGVINPASYAQSIFDKIRNAGWISLAPYCSGYTWFPCSGQRLITNGIR